MGTVEEQSRRAVFAERHGKFLPVDLCPTIAVRMGDDDNESCSNFFFISFTWLIQCFPDTTTGSSYPVPGRVAWGVVLTHAYTRNPAARRGSHSRIGRSTLAARTSASFVPRATPLFAHLVANHNKFGSRTLLVLLPRLHHVHQTGTSHSFHPKPPQKDHISCSPLPRPPFFSLSFSLSLYASP